MRISSAQIQEIWPLSEISVGPTLKESEKGRTIIRIDAKEGSFSYRIADESKKDTSLEKELLAFTFLPEHGFSAIPKLLKTQAGTLFSPVENNRYAYILEYIEGEHPKPSVETYTALGLLTAQLHNTKSYPYETEFNADLIAEKHLPERAEGLSFKEEYLEIARLLPKFNHFPKALIHTDVGPHNSIKSKNAFYFIDWDDVGMGPAILDIGFPLIQQLITEDRVLLEKEARAFYEAYFSVRTMSLEERKHIFDAAIFIALDYLIYGESPEKRFDRLKWAIENRDKIESLYLP